MNPNSRSNHSAPDGPKGRWSRLRETLLKAPERDDEEGLRPIGALVAIAAGLPTMVALIAAAADPRQSLIPVTLATGISAIMAGLALLIRLRSARDDIRRLEARLEAESDRRWEHEEVAATDRVRAAVVPPPLPVATVSHEMRTPLHGMLGITDLLLETSLTQEQQAYAAAIRSSAGSLSRLVDDLLDYSRIEAGRFLLEPTPTRIEPLLEQIAELMAPRAFAKGVGVATRFDPALPVVVVDDARLRQILINLLGNAIAFTDRGSVVLEARLADTTPDGGAVVRFCVTDNGPGIADADRNRIFGAFERASEAQGGTGLGLAISQRIVQRMGSTIELESADGGGSAFRFDLTLPRRNGVQPRDREILAGRKVLVAMSAALEAEAVLGTLRDAGAVAVLASRLDHAERLLAAEPDFDLALLGSDLGRDPALALSRLRRAAGRGLPTALLIEPRQRKDVDAFRADGIDAYLIRPVRRGSLLRIAGELAESGGAFQIDPADQVAEKSPPRSTQPGLRVLVAEDDPVSALLVRAVLEKLGHQVVDVASEAATLHVTASQRFDLALVDIHLGEDDGLAVIAGLRQSAEAGSLGIIALSGSTDLEIRLGAERAGADLFLEKPVSPDVLRRAIEVVAGRRAA